MHEDYGKFADAVSLYREGKYLLAENICRKICQSDNPGASAWLLLGVLLGHKDEHAEAEKCCRRAISLQPDSWSAHYNLGIILTTAKRYKEAEEIFRTALQTWPNSAELYTELGNNLRLQGKPTDAHSCYLTSIQLNPQSATAHLNLGMLIQTEIGNLETALPHLRSAYALDNSLIQAKAAEAEILERLGNIQDAYECLQPLLQSGSVAGSVAVAFSSVSKHMGREQEAIEHLQNSISTFNPPVDRLFILYQHLGDLHERLGDYDAAFNYFTRANELSIQKDNSEELLDFMRNPGNRYSGLDLREARSTKSNSGILTFIVGMPRSGTSLVEQILAAHPDVTARGELSLLQKLSDKLLASETNHDQKHHCQELVKQYISKMHALSMHALSRRSIRITDKNPYNFLYLELIQELFPGARVIHCMRNPLDTCLSCYTHQFNGEMLSFTNTLRTLGLVYRRYQEFMAYWRENFKLPMLEIQYEDLVENFEYKARELTSFCDLEWSEQCLNFHKLKRVVHTASYNQVKQPVYRSSIHKWEKYAHHLQILRETLD